MILFTFFKEVRKILEEEVKRHVLHNKSQHKLTYFPESLAMLKWIGLQHFRQLYLPFCFKETLFTV